ncbi:MAG: hypothetical protein QME71_08180 [Dehalococcoidia bacterium]|nr:hypothetical protein [Dehalococcoidia bacterium]
MVDTILLTQGIFTLVCAGFNAAYFAGYCLDGGTAARRRAGAAALAVINAAVLVESLSFLGLYAAHRSGSDALVISPSLWLPARTLLLAGVAFIAALIVRQRGRR